MGMAETMRRPGDRGLRGARRGHADARPADCSRGRCRANFSDLLQTLTVSPAGCSSGQSAADGCFPICATSWPPAAWRPCCGACPCWPPAPRCRIVSVPVEFAGVPAGMEIAEQSATRLEVQLRGTSWFMGSVRWTGLVARFDLKGAETGVAQAEGRPREPGPSARQ